MANLVGSTLGRYQLVEQLGEGGMAKVYKGYDTRLDRYVAIKVITQSQQDSARFLRRFEREAKALAKLSHPNIVKVHDYGEEHGLPYLVMEYIPGGTLKEKLGKPIPYEEASRLLKPIADALDYAHSLDIIHRDVKPANILLTATGIPMLSDFGIAKMLSSGESTELTGMGVGIGTPEYMAPEQGQGIGVDKRADIYSLGVVYYELVTGRKPFRADTPLAVIVKHISEPLPRPRQYVPNLPDSVERVIFTALAKQPDQRFQSMGEFSKALDSVVHAAPTWEDQPTSLRADRDSATQTQVKQPYQQPPVTQAPVYSQPPQYQSSPSTIIQPVQPPTSNSRMATWLIAGGIGLIVLLFIVVGGGLGAYFLWLRNTPTQAALVTKTHSPEELSTEILAEDTPTSTPQNPENSPTVQDIVITDTKQAPAATISATPTLPPTETSVPPTPTMVVSFQIAYALGDVGNSDIYVANENGNNQHCVACDGDYDEAEPAWAPDGSNVVFQANYSGSYDIYATSPTGTGQLYQITTASTTDEREPDWSINGYVAYRVSPKDSNRNSVGDVYVTRVQDGYTTSFGFQGRAPVWSPDASKIAFMSDASGTWQIYIYEVQSGAIQQITNTSVNCRWADWSPDGKYVAFNVSASAGSTDPAGIYYVSVDDKSMYTVIDGNGAGRPSWSDSGIIAMNTAAGIEILNVNGSNRSTLIDNSKAWAPAWSR